MQHSERNPSPFLDHFQCAATLFRPQSSRIAAYRGKSEHWNLFGVPRFSLQQPKGTLPSHLSSTFESWPTNSTLRTPKRFVRNDAGIVAVQKKNKQHRRGSACRHQVEHPRPLQIVCTIWNHDNHEHHEIVSCDPRPYQVVVVKRKT